MIVLPSVSIIRSVLWYVWPTFGFGYGAGAPQSEIEPYFTVQVMWGNRGLAFDWWLV